MKTKGRKESKNIIDFRTRHTSRGKTNRLGYSDHPTPSPRPTSPDKPKKRQDRLPKKGTK